jgi:SAM-dependent methyltransferase
MSQPGGEEIRRLYQARLGARRDYRDALWRILITEFFQRFVETTDTVLDLGCGYGEFIRQVRCGRKLAMDLNPDALEHVGTCAECLVHDCTQAWPVPDNSLDVVFTSNFFEHLPDKTALRNTLQECHRCLRPGGRLIALGPNIKYLPGEYWDFWDHHLPLTARSLAEGLENLAFKIEVSREKFLPYTAVHGPQYPLWCVRLYLRLRPAWLIWGKQFLVMASKASRSDTA